MRPLTPIGETILTFASPALTKPFPSTSLLLIPILRILPSPPFKSFGLCHIFHYSFIPFTVTFFLLFVYLFSYLFFISQPVTVTFFSSSWTRESVRMYPYNVSSHWYLPLLPFISYFRIRSLSSIFKGSFT